MTLAAGTRLGPYDIVAPLGAGGMGEVYRAKDTRLGREVAVKVLPPEVASDADRLRRFEQEARAASALSHPNILTLFDVGRDGVTSFLVTELLEGESLRERLAHGPLPPRKAIELGVEVARGLAAAHAKGIVHRDLKPENLFLTRDGSVKILDFGLAKLTLPEAGGMAEATTIPGLTATGMVMGTAGYMAPEQVRGETADARADLFALGCVLYEVVSGQRAFAGSSAPETLSAILRDEPAPLAVPAPTGAVLAGIVWRCLEKRPDDRFQSARDLGFALEALVAPTTPQDRASATSQPRRYSATWGLAAAALLGLGFVAGLFWTTRSTAPAPPLAALGSGSLVQLTTDPGYEGEPTFSPDGETIAYVADRDGNFEIYLQRISGGPAINLTRSPAADVQPAFSPDGSQIAFVSSRGGAGLMYAAARLPVVGGDIWTMPALGGAPRRIVEGGHYPSWSPDGTQLVYARGTFRSPRLAVVPASGGTSRDIPINESDSLRYFFPSFSADGRWLLYQDGQQIEVVASSGGQPTVIAAGSYPSWGPGSRSVLYSSGAAGKELTIWQLPFDLDTGTVAGEASPLTFGGGAAVGARTAPRGGAIAFAALDFRLNVEELPFDAESGRATGPPRVLTRGSHRIGEFDIAPGDGAIVFAENLGGGQQIWRLDPPAPPVQLTFETSASLGLPTWSPDGERIGFVRTPRGPAPARPELWIMSADGGSPRRLAEEVAAAAWLADGKRLVVQRADRLAILDLDSGAETPVEGASSRTVFTVDPAERWIVIQDSSRGNVDLVAVPLVGGEAQPVVTTPREDYHPMVSPSGNWLYFLPDHKNFARVPGPAQQWRPGEPEPVTSFPEDDLFLENPRLSADGRKLYYARGWRTADLWILRVDGPAPGSVSR